MKRHWMKCYIAVSFLFSTLQLCICMPSGPSQVQQSERDDLSPSHTAVPPMINTTAFSTKNTSTKPLNIETRLYIPQTASSNLTSRQILGERRILTCESPTATFHHSHCRTKSHPQASIRHWIAWCREPTPSGSPQPTFTLPSEARAMASSVTTQDTSLYDEFGTCEEDEICVDSLYSLDYREGMILIANCVKKDLFAKVFKWKPDWDDTDLDSDAEAEEWIAMDNERTAAADGTSSSGLDVSDDNGDDPDVEICNTQKPSSKDASGNPGCEAQHQQQQKLQFPPSLLAGRYASVVMSKDENGNIPVKVEELGLRSLANAANSSAGVEAPSKSAADGGFNIGDDTGIGRLAYTPAGVAEQERKCTECMKLKTIKPFTPDTEALEMEVKMVGAGSVALAGVLWVALLSG